MFESSVGVWLGRTRLPAPTSICVTAGVVDDTCGDTNRGHPSAPARHIPPEGVQFRVAISDHGTVEVGVFGTTTPQWDWLRSPLGRCLDRDVSASVLAVGYTGTTRESDQWGPGCVADVDNPSAATAPFRQLVDLAKAYLVAQA